MLINSRVCVFVSLLMDLLQEKQPGVLCTTDAREYQVPGEIYRYRLYTIRKTEIMFSQQIGTSLPNTYTNSVYLLAMLTTLSLGRLLRCLSSIPALRIIRFP